MPDRNSTMKPIDIRLLGESIQSDMSRMAAMRLGSRSERRRKARAIATPWPAAKANAPSTWPKTIQGCHSICSGLPGRAHARQRVDGELHRDHGEEDGVQRVQGGDERQVLTQAGQEGLNRT